MFIQKAGFEKKLAIHKKMPKNCIVITITVLLKMSKIKTINELEPKQK